jgi:hypothetical protein
MGNSDEVQTPNGLFATGDVGGLPQLIYYIGNYETTRVVEMKLSCLVVMTKPHDMIMISAVHIQQPCQILAFHTMPEELWLRLKK